MRILIIEDEIHTANRLKQLILEYNRDYEIVATLSSIDASVEWLKENDLPDLIFQDIQLKDGSCFEIYKAVDVKAPVIFTTAYSEYALKSFEVNSIGYLIKPYDFADIKRVLDKFRDFSSLFQIPQYENLKEIVSAKKTIPKKRFLIRTGDIYKALDSSQIAYIISDWGLSTAYTFEGEKYALDQSLNQLVDQLDISEFFRINRNCIVNSRSIQKISKWFNSRLKLQLIPKRAEEVIVSRERVKEFKSWMGAY
ncbi:MAG TPA: DNA-binding response regulator [Rikenellaceae bacterium]|nr:MAG: hypothetical protein A2X20_01385 [Bacteroidetes bacterium GWE2_40_15]HBZ24735.1 DNA-binding response regulator [Rikenellaceae bacterium]